MMKARGKELKFYTSDQEIDRNDVGKGNTAVSKTRLRPCRAPADDLSLVKEVP